MQLFQLSRTGKPNYYGVLVIAYYCLATRDVIESNMLINYDGSIFWVFPNFELEKKNV